MDTFTHHLSTIHNFMEASWEQSVTHSINTIYLLFSAYLVFVMQTGLAMICAGSVRAENAMNIMLNNVVDAVVGSISFYLFGFAFAYGNSNPFIGTNLCALANIPNGTYDYMGLCTQVWPIGFGHPVVGQVQGQVSCSWAQEPLTLLGVRVVHMVGAIAGFWGSIIEGPHVGRFDAFGKPVPLQGHNATLVITRLQLVKLLLSPHWPDRRLAPSPCSGDDY
ncbi:hypothetical protein AHAS_Ahas11G0039100 [Arachis hypogaea]